MWATLGQYIRAEALAHSITNLDRQMQALEAVARAPAGAGQYEQAAVVAGSIPSPDRRVQALAAVASALARAGQHEQTPLWRPGPKPWPAISPSRTGGRRRWRPRRWRRGGDTRQARHVASAACAVVRWTTVLGLVLSLEPSAIRVLTDL